MRNNKRRPRDYSKKPRQKTVVKDTDIVQHHRRPSSLGGSNDPSNISFIKRSDHQAWHCLFGNLNVFQTKERLTYYLFKHGFESKLSVKFIGGTRVKRRGEHVSNNKTNAFLAWNHLFEKMENTKEILSCINTNYLDPCYILIDKL